MTEVEPKFYNYYNIRNRKQSEAIQTILKWVQKFKQKERTSDCSSLSLYSKAAMCIKSTLFKSGLTFMPIKNTNWIGTKVY